MWGGVHDGKTKEVFSRAARGDGAFGPSGTKATRSGEGFEPSAQAIRNWVKQAELDEGTRTDGLKTEEREELSRLRREIARLKEEREILSKAAAWFAQETEKKSKRSSSS
jgi:transposase